MLEYFIPWAHLNKHLIPKLIPKECMMQYPYKAPGTWLLLTYVSLQPSS